VDPLRKERRVLLLQPLAHERRPSRIWDSSGLSSGAERMDVTVKGLGYDGF
jgi:hypothetical protein